MKVKINNTEYDLNINKSNDIFEIILNHKGEFASKICFGYEIINDNRCIWLYKIETEYNFRKFGLGSKLMQTMEYIALKNNINYVEGFYFPDDYVIASMFYYKNGYKFDHQNGSTHIYKKLKRESIKNEVIYALECEKKYCNSLEK